MTAPLAGRVALVTGAGRGIGRAIALRLAADGATVAVNARSAERDAVAAEIVAAGGRALAVGGDVGDPDAVEAAFTEVEATVGPVEILVNNAGVHRGGRVDKLSLEDFDLVVRASLYGSFHCARRAVPAMREAGWGRIVQIASPAGVRGFPGDVAYGSAKAAQLGLTRCLALELAPVGITVNAVLPGYVETTMTASLSEKSRAGLVAALPMRRPTEADEVAASVAHLAAPASAAITGVTLPVDGGITV